MNDSNKLLLKCIRNFPIGNNNRGIVLSKAALKSTLLKKISICTKIFEWIRTQILPKIRKPMIIYKISLKLSMFFIGIYSLTSSSGSAKGKHP